MKTTLRKLVPLAAIGLLMVGAIARADDEHSQRNAYTTTPLVSLHFFRRSPAGRQIDLDADIRNTVE